MSTRKTTAFYGVLLVVASLFVGMVIASRFDLTPASSAQTIAVPPMNSAPINGPLDAQTFRNVAKMATPIVVNIRTEMKAKGQDLTDFFGGGGGTPDDLFHRFFGGPGGGAGGDQDQQDNQGGRGNGRRRQREQTTRAAGTGFIISKDGYIQRADSAPGEADSSAAGGEIRRLVAGGGRRLGDGHRQPVWLCAHRDGGRHQRDVARVSRDQRPI